MSLRAKVRFFDAKICTQKPDVITHLFTIYEYGIVYMYTRAAGRPLRPIRLFVMIFVAIFDAHESKESGNRKKEVSTETK